jgi:hypothetical protein
LSRIFSAIGLRERRAGAGRKPSPDTLELLAHAQAKYGKRAVKVLRAAWRDGKAQMVASLTKFVPQPGTAAKLRVASPLRSHGANYGPVIRWNGKAVARSRVSLHPVSAITFKRNVNKTTKTRNKTHGMRP